MIDKDEREAAVNETHDTGGPILISRQARKGRVSTP